MHHVHQEIFIEHMKFPLSYIGKFIEGKMIPSVYRNRTVITVSESSKEDILRVGIAKERNIQIVNPGITIPQEKYRKTKAARSKAYAEHKKAQAELQKCKDRESNSTEATSAKSNLEKAEKKIFLKKVFQGKEKEDNKKKKKDKK